MSELFGDENEDTHEARKDRKARQAEAEESQVKKADANKKLKRQELDEIWKLKEKIRREASTLTFKVLTEMPEVIGEYAELPGIEKTEDLGSYEYVNGEWRFRERAAYNFGDVELKDIFDKDTLLALRRIDRRRHIEESTSALNRRLEGLFQKLKPLIDSDTGEVNQKWRDELEEIKKNFKLESLSEREVHSTRIIGINDLLGRKREKPKIIVEQLLAKGWIALLAGASKSYKSWMTLQMALEASKGGKWLDFQCQRSRVLYIDYELSHTSITRRLELLKLSKVKAEHGPDFLILGSNTQRRNQIAVILEEIRRKKYPDKEFDENVGHQVRKKRDGRGEYIEILDEELYCDEYDLIIIDPLYMLLNGRDENSATDIVDVFNDIRSLKRATGAAILINTHFRKGFGDNRSSTSDRISGSGVFTRYPDVVLTLSRLNEGTRRNAKKQALENTFRMEFTLRHLDGHDPIGLKFLRYECRFKVMRKDETDVVLETHTSTTRGPKSKTSKRIQEYLRNNHARLSNQPLAFIVQDAQKLLGISRPTLYRFFEKHECVVPSGDGKKKVYLPFAERNK